MDHNQKNNTSENPRGSVSSIKSLEVPSTPTRSPKKVSFSDDLPFSETTDSIAVVQNLSSSNNNDSSRDNNVASSLSNNKSPTIVTEEELTAVNHVLLQAAQYLEQMHGTRERQSPTVEATEPTHSPPQSHHHSDGDISTTSVHINLKQPPQKVRRAEKRDYGGGNGDGDSGAALSNGRVQEINICDEFDKVQVHKLPNMNTSANDIATTATTTTKAAPELKIAAAVSTSPAVLKLDDADDEFNSIEQSKTLLSQQQQQQQQQQQTKSQPIVSINTTQPATTTAATRKTFTTSLSNLRLEPAVTAEPTQPTTSAQMQEISEEQSHVARYIDRYNLI
ncbi:unnamed protein product [Ceratitis capitata]|uniref:(Mediterranean fruit fly) hypothetical protein n=1 Tax=Ceratitis capitata TaxID=7213 RepID=A0A811VI07_CERCA|nr:unnamed protein product [Ceratitis capitata]